MLGPCEMACDELMNVLPEAVGKKQQRQSGDSQKHNESLNLETFGSAEAPHNLRKNPDDEEVAADQENREGGSQYGPRGIRIDLSKSGTHIGNHQEDTPDQQSARLNA